MTLVNLKRLSVRVASAAIFAALAGLLFSPFAVAAGDVGGAFTVGTNLLAETRLAIEKDSDNVIVLTVYIDRIKDKDTGVTKSIPGGIGSYSATAVADSDIQIVAVRGVSPYPAPTFDPGTGIFSVNGLSGLPQPNNAPIAKLVVRLTGSCVVGCGVNIAFQQIIAASDPGINVPETGDHSLTFLRGDTKNDGLVNIVDAMYIAQYLVGIRQLTDINPINAASVRQDGSSGDIINIVDAMFIAQELVGLRDDHFNSK